MGRDTARQPVAESTGRGHAQLKVILYGLAGEPQDAIVASDRTDTDHGADSTPIFTNGHYREPDQSCRTQLTPGRAR